MMDALLVSNALLWLLVVALAGVVAALARQVGVLHERLAPLGALAISARTRARRGRSRAARARAVGRVGPDRRRGRVGPQHAPVLRLADLPDVQDAAPDRAPRGRRRGGTAASIASDGDPAEHAAFAREQALDPASYVLSRELGLRYEVAKLPYAVLIDAAGIVRAKGIVNTREHVESLFEAERLGVPTIQAHLALAAAIARRSGRIAS